MKKERTDFGKKIKIALIGKDASQDWLIREVKQKTGLYFDSSYLNKIMTGTNKNPTIISCICEILGISED